MFYWFAYYLIKSISFVFAPIVIRGKENILSSGGAVLASNHASNLDPFLIGLCFKRRISYMAKDSLFNKKAMKFMLERVEAFPVRRGEADIRSLREAIRRLKRGLPMVVFPEGTRKGSGQKQKSNEGVGFLAVKANVPVIPIHISGSEKALPPGAKFFKRHKVVISFGMPRTFSKDQSYPEITSQILKDIYALETK